MAAVVEDPNLFPPRFSPKVIDEICAETDIKLVTTPLRLAESLSEFEQGYEEARRQKEAHTPTDLKTEIIRLQRLISEARAILDPDEVRDWKRSVSTVAGETPMTRLESKKKYSDAPDAVRKHSALYDYIVRGAQTGWEQCGPYTELIDIEAREIGHCKPLTPASGGRLAVHRAINALSSLEDWLEEGSGNLALIPLTEMFIGQRLPEIFEEHFGQKFTANKGHELSQQAPIKFAVAIATRVGINLSPSSIVAAWQRARKRSRI